MSFSSEVKEELSHVDGHENHCMIAELAAIIGLCGKIKCEDGRYSLILHTENVSVARRFYSLIKDVFHFQPQVSTTQHEFLKKNRFYMISIEESGQTLKILKTAQLINNLGQMDEEFSVKIIRYCSVPAAAEHFCAEHFFLPVLSQTRRRIIILKLPAYQVRKQRR